jgi:hypothetical protein
MTTLKKKSINLERLEGARFFAQDNLPNRTTLKDQPWGLPILERQVFI